MNKLFIIASVAIASMVSITGCGTSSSGGDGGSVDPRKELVFDMNGEYDLASYIVLDRNGSKYFKETTKVNKNGVDSYDGIVGTDIYFTSTYTKDGQDIRVVSKTSHNTVMRDEVDYGLFDTKIQRTNLYAANSSSNDSRITEFARHIDKKDIIAKGNSKYTLCRFDDTKERMTVENFEYTNIIIVTCDIENNTTGSIDGDVVAISYKGKDTRYYAKNNALIKSVERICKNTKMDGEDLDKRCVETTIEQLP